MGVVFEEVCRRLGLSAKADPATELVAAKIIEIAANNEHDPEQLRQIGLKAFRTGRD